MVTGAIAAPAVYAGYSRLFPGQTAPPARQETPASGEPAEPAPAEQAPVEQTTFVLPRMPMWG
jgi:hypothetical protein